VAPVNAIPVHEEADWRAASALSDIGELTAQWLEGRRSWIPTYVGSHPHPETDPVIRTTLARVNRAGWVTDSSQPGTDRGTVRQRAYVTGVAPPALAQSAQRLAAASGLLVIRGRQHRGRANAVPVTVRHGQETTWLGSWAPPDNDVLLDAPLPAAGVTAVRESDALQVYDPVWGRNDVLWPWLLALTDDAHRLEGR
jgi:hypothetical protein